MITVIARGAVMTVIMKLINKIKEFLEEVKDVIDWIIAGCPKPIPVKPNRRHSEHPKRKT